MHVIVRCVQIEGGNISSVIKMNILMYVSM